MYKSSSLWFPFQDELGPDIGQSVLAQEFVAHGDKLCHVAAMASASTMDPRSMLTVLVCEDCFHSLPLPLLSYYSLVYLLILIFISRSLVSGFVWGFFWGGGGRRGVSNSLYLSPSLPLSLTLCVCLSYCLHVLTLSVYLSLSLSLPLSLSLFSVFVSVSVSLSLSLSLALRLSVCITFFCCVSVPSCVFLIVHSCTLSQQIVCSFSFHCLSLSLPPHICTLQIYN